MWKLSNPPPLLCATLMASLDVSHSFLELSNILAPRARNHMMRQQQLTLASFTLLQIFSQTSMEEISRKQFLLTGYLEVLLKLYFSRSRPHHHNGHHSDMENSNVLSYIDDLPSIDILTPSDPKQRGSQLSISFSVPLCAVQEELKKNGVVVRKSSHESVLIIALYHTREDGISCVLCKSLSVLVSHVSLLPLLFVGEICYDVESFHRPIV